MQWGEEGARRVVVGLGGGAVGHKGLQTVCGVQEQCGERGPNERLDPTVPPLLHGPARLAQTKRNPAHA